MIYLLDSSILIELLRNNQQVWSFIEDHLNDEFSTSVICEAEIYEGIFRERKENIPVKKEAFLKILAKLSNIIPFSSDQAEQAGKIRAELSKKGQLIEDMDILIASAAICNQATLWTQNSKHFSRIKNLQLLELPAAN